MMQPSSERPSGKRSAGLRNEVVSFPDDARQSLALPSALFHDFRRMPVGRALVETKPICNSSEHAKDHYRGLCPPEVGERR